MTKILRKEELKLSNIQFLYGSGLANKTDVTIKPGTIYLDLLTKEMFFDDPSEGNKTAHQKIIDTATLIYALNATFPTTASSVTSGLLKTRDGKTFAPATLIGNIYNADGTIFDAVTKGYVDTNLQTITSDINALEDRYTKLNASGTLGSSKKPIYISEGKFTASSSTVGGNAKFMYLKSGTMTASTANIGSDTQLIFLAEGTFTASTANVGGVTTPVYIKDGVITEIIAIDGAHGGTGVSSHTANRLVWSTNATTIEGSYHYASTSKVGINYTSEPSYNFYVNGTSGFGGDVTISNGNLKIYRETTKAADAPAKLAFSVKQTDTPVTTESAYIAVYDDHDGYSYGTNMVITSPSALIIGGGESASGFYANVVKGTSAENTYITADSAIQFFTNCNTITDRVGVALSTSRAFYPMLNSTGTAGGTLGTADYNWSAAHVRSIISNDELTLSSKSGKATTIASGSTVYIQSGNSASILFKPQGVEQGRFNTSGHLEIISGGAAKATITGPDTAGAFLFPNTGGTFVTHATRGTAVGGSTRPVYIASTGRATAITCLSTTYGGTGNDTQTANRLAYTDSQNKISTANSHYVSSTTVCVNSTAAPTSGANLYVNGIAQIDGELSLDNEVKFVYNSSDKCVDVIFI